MRFDRPISCDETRLSSAGAAMFFSPAPKTRSLRGGSSSGDRPGSTSGSRSIAESGGRLARHRGNGRHHGPPTRTRRSDAARSTGSGRTSGPPRFFSKAGVAPGRPRPWAPHHRVFSSDLDPDKHMRRCRIGRGRSTYRRLPGCWFRGAASINLQMAAVVFAVVTRN